MPHVTTCPKCGALYEASSEEEANSPDRMCRGCYVREIQKPDRPNLKESTMSGKYGPNDRIPGPGDEATWPSSTNHPNDPRNDDIEDEPSLEEQHRMADESAAERDYFRELDRLGR